MTPQRKALMACSNDWDSPFQVGSHHIARALVRRGWRVAFVSDPISPLHLLGSGLAAGAGAADLRRRWRLYAAGGRRDLEGRLWAYVPGALLAPHNRPVLRRRWVLRRWPALTLPGVVGRARAAGFARVDLLYLDSAAQSFWLDRLPHGRSVYRVADNIEGFPKFTSALGRAERELVARADAVALAGTTVRPRIQAMGPRRVLEMPNGVDFARFAAGPADPPPEYAGLPRPILVYVGAMQEWFDFDLVARLARRRPGASVVLIGPDALARRRLGHLPNVRLLGPRAPERLPPYLHHADVGLIPFDVAGHGRLVHSVHPLKLYEYLACGLPVVAVEWDELRRLGSPATLCRSAEEFLGAVDRSAAAPGAPGQDRQRLVRYAAGHDWSGRVADLLDALGLGT